MRPKSIYALYKGDTFIAIGTMKQLAEREGIAEESLRFKSTPAYHRRVMQKKIEYENEVYLLNLGREDYYEQSRKKRTKRNSK